MDAAVFLDRDGVIIENVATHVRSWDEVVFLPGALESLATLALSPYKVVIVTNQSVIGHGIINYAAAEAINNRILDVIVKAGGRVDRVYMCPHVSSDLCNCRKPRPGMILQAVEELGLDVGRSFLIGDAVTDLQAGMAAGITKNILVQTGRGEDQARLLDEVSQSQCRILKDIPAAVSEILTGKL
jgi:D-glycero-D-manno-heptose 1,7-bisphosphate phosphatase